jgi:hypothetical protein
MSLDDRFAVAQISVGGFLPTLSDLERLLQQVQQTF